MDTNNQTLTDQEYALIFNLLGSDRVSIPGNLVNSVATIRDKIVKHLQPKEVDNGDSPDTAE